MSRGYFAIGIEHNKIAINIGTLWRSAYLFGASYIFTINRRYKKQTSDVYKSWRHIPLHQFSDFDNFYEAIPYDCLLVGIELIDSAIAIKEFKHPQRAIYLLGAEDHGLTKQAIEKCHNIIKLPTERSLNVATAGSIVMFDRINKDDTRD